MAEFDWRHSCVMGKCFDPIKRDVTVVTDGSRYVAYSNILEAMKYFESREQLDKWIKKNNIRIILD